MNLNDKVLVNIAPQKVLKCSQQELAKVDFIDPNLYKIKNFVSKEIFKKYCRVKSTRSI